MLSAEHVHNVLAHMGIHAGTRALHVQLERDLGIDSAELADLELELGQHIGSMLPPRYLQKTDTLGEVVQKINLWVNSGGLDYATV